MLQVIFGDDEHTASEGAYSRLMKTRKWVYLAAATAAFLSMRLYDAQATSDIVRIVELPWWLLSKSIMFGGTYLLVLYVLLIMQLLTSYDIVLNERLAFRRAEQLDAAQERIEIQRRAVMDRHRDEMDQADKMAAEARSDRAKLRTARDQLRVSIRSNEEAYGRVAQEKLAQSREKLAEVEAALERADEVVHSLDIPRESPPRVIMVDEDPGVIAARDALERLKNQNPADRKGYRKSEIAIDTLRIAAPMVVGGASLTNLMLAILQG